MKKILEKSGKSQGILSEEKSGNPVQVRKYKYFTRKKVMEFWVNQGKLYQIFKYIFYMAGKTIVVSVHIFLEN